MILRRPNILIRGEAMSNKLLKMEKALRHEVGGEIYCREWHSSIVIEGIVDKWSEVIRAGKLAANKGYKAVVNKLEVRGLELWPMKKPILIDSFLQGKKVDALIIGGGITGSAIARELSKWNISVLLLDKECDFAMHTSSRNDGMVHPGIEPKPESKRAIYNVRVTSYTRR